MESPKPPPLKLFSLNAVETRDEFDDRLERCHFSVLDIIKSTPSEAEAHDAFNTKVCKSAAAHEEVCNGLLTSILVDPVNAPKYYRDLTFVNRDGLVVVINTLSIIALEKYTKLHENARLQLIWLISEMIKTNTNGLDGVVLCLFRQIPGGDLSPKSVWLAEKLVDLLIENRLWLDKLPVLVATSVYTYLRIIVDHLCSRDAQIKELRQKEIDFCVSLLRERFIDCMTIGRDLVRLLQNVARVPEIELIWKDIQKNPTVLCPTFTGGVTQLMQTRTSRRFLQCRLTPEMERKIVFLTSNVKFGQQKRYQDWFQRQYLATPESQSLRCDLIRFICGVIHPSNEVLCSDIIPRWAIIGWILSSCTSNIAASNAKLSLFYDWLFYDERDNIMNIEPAILVMHHSVRSHPVISVTLLDFLCRITRNFHPALDAQVRTGVHTALQQILDKRVLPSLAPLFEAPKLDRELRVTIKETFPEFCTVDAPVIHLVDNDALDLLEPSGNNHNSDLEARFSDEDSEDSGSPRKKTKSAKILNNYDGKKNSSSYAPSKLDLSSLLEQLPDDMRSCLLSLQGETDNEARCESMDKLIQLVLRENDFYPELASSLACALCQVLKEDFSKPVFPGSLDEESLEDSIGAPLFVILRNMCQTPEDDQGRAPLLNLLTEMASQTKRIGYSLLYYIKVSKTQDVSSYKEYSKQVAKDLNACLLNDMRVCQDEDVNMFCFILPDIYRDFESTVISSAHFIHLTVSCIDASQLQDLICHVIQGNMRMLRKESVVSLINASLEWETFEQYCLWQLIAAHNISIESILPALPKLEFQTHSEALTSILLSLKRVEPAQDLLKHIINRDPKSDDLFVVSVLKFWSSSHEKKLAELISASITKTTTSPAKRGKRINTTKSQLSAAGEQLLAHLDHLRQKSKTGAFFNQESMQSALLSAQNACSEAQKSRFGDLFALAEEIDSRPKRGKNAKGAKAKSKPADSSNSETDASEEENNAKPVKNAVSARKKRKTVAASDSD